jgi:hypothetical protein
MSLGATAVEFGFLWVVSVVPALSAATGTWLGDVGFRNSNDAYLMSWLVLLNRRQAIWPWTLICGSTWVAVFVGPEHLTARNAETLLGRGDAIELNLRSTSLGAGDSFG